MIGRSVQKLWSKNQIKNNQKNQISTNASPTASALVKIKNPNKYNKP